MPHTNPGRDVRWTRRKVLKSAGALAVAAAAALAGQGVASEAPAGDPKLPPAGKPADPKAPAMKIGVLLGTFTGPSLEARLDAVKACGLDCVQLSMK